MHYFMRVFTKMVAKGLCLISLALVLAVQAAPFKGDIIPQKQPDGSTVQVAVFGDEFYMRIESLDGYTLVRGDNDWICFGRLSADRTALESTGEVYVDSIKSTPAVAGRLGAKHIQLPPEILAQKINEGRNLLLSGIKPGINAATSLAGNTPLPSTAFSTAATAAGGTDTITGLVILIDFPDEKATISRTEIDNYFNQVGYSGYGNNGSVRDYWFSVSNGKVVYKNVVVGYYRAQYPKDDYDTPFNNGKDIRKESLDWLSTQNFDFSKVTIGADNSITAITYFYAGYFGRYGLRPHRSWMDYTFPNGIRGISYDIVDIQPKLILYTVCHETGHLLFGWPDLYSQVNSFGLGSYCLMSWSCSNTNPLPPNPWLRLRQGWENVIDIYDAVPGTTYSHTCGSFTSYRFRNPAFPAEYFLVESGYKTGRYQFVFDEGLMIWHIDDWDLQPSHRSKYYRVALEQADGRRDIEYGDAGGTGDMFHDGYSLAFNNYTFPSSKLNEGGISGFKVTNIGPIGPSMTFTVGADPNGTTIPGGTIEAESYKSGGQGVGYRDLSAGNSGGAFRTDDVDIEQCTDDGLSGFCVTDIQAGEWMAYDVYVPLLGSYSLVARVASALAGVKTLSVTVDGGTPIPISFNVSDGEHSWIYAQSESVVTLTPGYHVVRVTALTGGFNLNYLLVLLNPNLKPVANAGLSQNVGFNTLVKLDGSGSIDPDNGPLPLTYSWTQVLGTSVTLSDPKSPTPTFQTPSVSSQIFFVLVVSDGVSNNEDLVAIDVSTNYVLFTAVSPTIGGTVSGASIYGPGQAATITATPASGYEFTSWSGDLTGSTNPATIVMNSNFSIIANFKLAGLTKVTPSTVSASSTESASYSASAAIDGSTTTRWASAFSDPQWIMFDMGSAKSITTVVFDWETANATNYLLEGSNDASFATKTTLATKINMGAVDHRIDSLSGLTGTYRYYRMYGTARNTAYGYSIYEARFYTGGTAATYTIAASNGPNGTILPAGNVSVNQNANQTFTVTPGSAYVVDAVTVDGVSQGSISNYTFTNVIANHTINATFKPVSVNYTLTTFASPNTFGTVTMSPTGGTYTSGTVVTVTANPASGYIFDSWSGDASGTVSSTTVLMNSNKTVTAKFVLQGGPLVKQTVSSTSASSTESGANSAGMSIDNNTATRWSSLFSDPQWISFDMGSSKSITSVCPKTLRFQTSVYFRKQITGKKRWRSDPTQV